MPKKILLVEDDLNFGTILKDYLILNGYQVTHALNGVQGLERFKSQEFHMCILDVMMPHKDGFSLAGEIRAKNTKIPLFFLTAKALKHDVIKGYKIGADDYLNKPFDSDILLSKINAVFERKIAKSGQRDMVLKDDQIYTIGDFVYDPKLRTLIFQKTDTKKLSPKENQLLHLLAINLNNLMPREEALLSIWKDDNYFTSRSMDVYVAKLRKYLNKDPKVEILNIHGEGFRLVAPVPS